MSDWVVVYGDYSTYAGDPFQAPATNVQVILVEDPDHGFELVYGGQGFYIYEDDTWRLAEDWFALHDYLTRPGAKRVLFGRTLDNAEFRKILQFATDHVGPKTGWWPHERRS